MSSKKWGGFSKNSTQWILSQCRHNYWMKLEGGGNSFTSNFPQQNPSRYARTTARLIIFNFNLSSVVANGILKAVFKAKSANHCEWLD